ncbi:hypothetical protein [Sphingobacterium sp. UBA5670]|uniref:hypothetical protein n=1 Tax=Sphingobacterium sp. UBA5670 TaxID=1947502 RepID=UPI0025E7FF00|nr:hypothetical protein [Sphingobacterium sp. UBA5670]
MRRTVVVDTFSVGGFHEMFNASFLYVVLNSTTGSLTYIADKSAISNIKNLLKEDHGFHKLLNRIVFHEKSLPKGNSFYAIFFRYLYGSLLNIFYLIKFRAHTVIFPSLNPLFAVIFKILSRILKTPTYVVCHGELGYLFSSYKVTSPLFWYSLFLKPFFRGTLPKNLKLIILGPSIVRNLSKYYPNLAKNMISLHHPYIFTAPVAKNDNKSDNIRFGWVGVATEAKGFKMFDEITKYFSDKYAASFSAHLIGWHNFDTKDYPYIKFASLPNVFIDRDKFNKEVSKLDYILFFYDNRHYQFTASGAIFDAIQQNKFVIALRNDYFESIFDACGPIGFLCDSKEELVKVIAQVMHGEIDLKQFSVNLESARNIFSCQQMKIIL